MNTFLNIVQEYGLDQVVKAWSNPCGLYKHLTEQRAKLLKQAQAFDLQKRIYRRGLNEQYQNKFVSNYYGAKRLSKSHVFCALTII